MNQGDLWFFIGEGWVASLAAESGGDCTNIEEFNIEDILPGEATATPSLISTPLPPHLFGRNAEGVFVITSRESADENSFWLVSNGEISRLDIPSTNSLYPAISPNGNYIAYLSFEENSISVQLLDISENSISTLYEAGTDSPGEKIGLFPLSWLDDTTLLVTMTDIDPEVNSGIFTLKVGDYAVSPQPEMIVFNGAVPSASLDGRFVAFEREKRDGVGRDIYVAILQNRQAQIISAPDAKDCFAPAIGANYVLYFICEGENETRTLFAELSTGEPIEVNLDFPGLDLGNINNLSPLTSDAITFDDGSSIYVAYFTNGLKENPTIERLIDVEDQNATNMRWATSGL
ncbi:MAG: PD40 domain-containing protein, partial [Anaerolineaceae bacterium]|nr:PD40 domain-containing protein [Anaerolineaceae bacterium]